jgi:ABC-2 type transport system permease protein
MLVGFFKASAMADLEYRLNLVVKIATDVIWYVAQLAIFEILFSHTSNISGWTLASTRVFMGVLFVTDALYMLFIQENLDRLSDKVRRGELDLLLVKPVNSQFMLSFQRMSPAYLGNLILTAAWLTWALINLPEPVPLTRLLTLFVSIPCSIAVSYSIRFFFSATALIFTRAENVNYIWYQLYRLGTRPDTIFPQWLRYVAFTFLPVAFIASVPARLILNAPDPILLGGAIMTASFAVYLTTRYWQYTLKFYSSASS